MLKDEQPVGVLVVGSRKTGSLPPRQIELLKTEGRVQELAGLIQERYAITRDEAEAAIKGRGGKSPGSISKV